MSLIGDALKKAHLETVRQDGSSTRLVHTPGVAQYRSDPSRVGRKGWTIALVASNVLLAIVVASVVFWGINRDGSGAEASPTAPAGSQAVSAGTTASESSTETPPASEPETVAEPSPALVATTGQKPSTSRPAPAETETSPPAQALEPEAPRVAAQQPSAPAASTQAPSRPTPPVTKTTSSSVAPRTRGGFTDGQTYMRSIPVPGGRDLQINGMSVAAGRGVALINGKMVKEGDRIGPFTVGKIADRRVQFHYEDITIYLKMP